MENSITRRTGPVTGQILWPDAWKRWDELEAETRNHVRTILDEAVDLIAKVACPYG
jgi:hypothetical protein